MKFNGNTILRNYEPKYIEISQGNKIM